MANLFPIPVFISLDANGDTQSGAKLNFYESGTTVRLNTFSDESLETAHANPVVADSAGRFAAIYMQAADYKVVWTDSADVVIMTWDPVPGTLDAKGDDFSPSQQSAADMTVLLAAGSLFDVVTKTLVTVAAQTTATITAPVSNPRIDIVYVDRLTGADGIETGVEDASPSDPTIANDKLPVARVTLATSTTEITDSLIDDIRELNLLGSGPWVRKSDLVLAKTTTYPVVIADNGKLINCDATSGGFTVTLPTVATALDGFTISVKKTDSSTNAVTVDGNGAETIDGATTRTLDIRYDAETYRCDGTEWHVTSVSRPDIVSAAKAPPEISIGTDTAHDINIVAGNCRADNVARELVNDALTKQLDAPWAVGTAAGGNDQLQLDGAQTVTFTDNGGSDDFVSIDSGTWTVTPSIGDTLIVTGSASNDGTYQVTAGTTTQIDVATASFAAEATSAAVINTIKIDTWYHKYLIRRSDTGVVDAVFSEGATTPDNLPSNYDEYRRLGAVQTDGSANILGFTQIGDEFLWDAIPHDINDNITSTATLHVMSVPLGIKVRVHFNIYGTLAGTIGVLASSPDQDDVAVDPVLGTLSLLSLNASAAQLDVMTDTSSQIRLRTNSGSNWVSDGATVGWADRRGRDA